MPRQDSLYLLEYYARTLHHASCRPYLEVCNISIFASNEKEARESFNRLYSPLKAFSSRQVPLGQEYIGFKVDPEEDGLE